MGNLTHFFQKMSKSPLLARPWAPLRLDIDRCITWIYVICMKQTLFTIPAIFSHGIKAVSRGISRGKQVIKFANTSNCGWVCLFLLSKWEDGLMVMQNVQFKFWQNLCHYCLLHKKGHLHCMVATASRKVTTINSTHNLPLSSLRCKVLHFLLSRMNKLNCDLLHWKIFLHVSPLRNHVTLLLPHQ